jgi:hypothetical protein
VPFKALFKLTCLAVLLSSCTQVTIHDEQFWGIKGPLGATGVHTLTNEIVHVDKATWDKMSVGYIAEEPGVFADIKLSFERMCEMLGPSCTVEVQQQATKMFRQIESAHGGPLMPNENLPLLKALKKSTKSSAKGKPR